MTAPSWYGEPYITADERALNLVKREGKIRQDEALDELSGGFDTRRDTGYNALNRLIASGDVFMVWNRTGYPFYLSPEVYAGTKLAELEGLPVFA